MSGAIYSGNWLQGQKNGTGNLKIYSNLKYFADCWQNDCLNCDQGVIIEFQSFKSKCSVDGFITFNGATVDALPHSNSSEIQFNITISRKFFICGTLKGAFRSGLIFSEQDKIGWLNFIAINSNNNSSLEEEQLIEICKSFNNLLKNNQNNQNDQNSIQQKNQLLELINSFNLTFEFSTFKLFNLFEKSQKKINHNRNYQFILENNQTNNQFNWDGSLIRPHNQFSNPRTANTRFTNEQTHEIKSIRPIFSAINCFQSTLLKSYQVVCAPAYEFHESNCLNNK
eukprot:TRINITY_DN1220_c2_g1_i2.p1 TRINITY_DN1220_c2_g1~~TRINITY_DN1220_c2_g1_i2.p1  ORF type:complete len:283 (-),score=109.31 TRINITY_DN1220_c2_g1_i2:11-859(-)